MHCLWCTWQCACSNLLTLPGFSLLLPPNLQELFFGGTRDWQERSLCVILQSASTVQHSICSGLLAGLPSAETKTARSAWLWVLSDSTGNPDLIKKWKRSSHLSLKFSSLRKLELICIFFRLNHFLCLISWCIYLALHVSYCCTHSLWTPNFTARLECAILWILSVSQKCISNFFLHRGYVGTFLVWGHYQPLRCFFPSSAKA